MQSTRERIMGAGNSRVKEKLIVEVIDDNDIEVNVDIDTSVIDKVEKAYLEGRESFSMSSLQVIDYLEENNIRPVWGWDLIEKYPEEIEGDLWGDKPIIDIKNEDLRYFIYTSAKTVVDIQRAFNEATGEDIPLVSRVCFNAMVDSDKPSTKGEAERHTITYNGKEYYSTYIVLSSGERYRLNLDTYRELKENKFHNLMDDKYAFYLNEVSNSYHGWFSVTGAYSRTTISHEIGHAFMTTLLNEMPSVIKGKNISSRIKSLVEDQELYDSPVSGYARRNKKEAFAECFNLYVYGGKSESKQYKAFCEIMTDCGLDSMYGCLK